MNKFYIGVVLLLATALVNAQQDDGVTDEIIVSSVGQKTAVDIISSTDIVDHIRSIELNVARGSDAIMLSPEYLERTQANDQRMVEEAEELSFENNE